MEPASLRDIQKLDKATYKVLKEREIKALYVGQIRVGENSKINYNEKAIIDGEVTEIDQQYCVKAIVASYESTDEVYNADYWVQSPESGKVESLTPDTLFVTPNHTDKDDENGFNHNSNPVAIAGDGVYTVVFAQYASPTADKAVIGLGLIKA